MNKVLMSLIFGTFILTGQSFAQTPPPAEAPAVAAPEAVKPMHHEHHPEIHKAMRKLRGAKQDLEKAAHIPFVQVVPTTSGRLGYLHPA